MYPELFLPFLLLIVLSAPTRYECPSRRDTARVDARTLHPVAEKYLVDHPDSVCPTVQTLIDAGELSKSSRVLDPWDNPYGIECEGDDIRVRSAGADQRFHTADDIVIPEPSAT